MDVKVGTGAFMPSYDKSVELAESIVAVGNGAGTRTSALLTEMNESLGSLWQAMRWKCVWRWIT